MKFRTRSVEDDEREKQERHMAEVLQARLEIARSNKHWVELDEVDLFPRGPRYLGYLVAASDDTVYTRHAGAVFAFGSTTLIATHQPSVLYWFEDRSGGIVFLDRQEKTWSEIVERRERRLAGLDPPRIAPRRR